MSPIAALTGSSAGTAARTPAITAGDGAPSEPSAGFLTSTMSAPAAAAARASSASTTLTSSLMADAGAAVVERHELHAPPPRRVLHAARELASGRLAADDPVDRRSPRALAGARRPAAQQRLDERARARMEAPALHRGERVADELLDARQRAAELLELALDERRQQRREHELRDGRRSLGRRHEPLERLRLGGPGQPRLGVAGTTITIRHSSGIA